MEKNNMHPQNGIFMDENGEKHCIITLLKNMGAEKSIPDATTEIKGVVKMASSAGTISTANVETEISGTQADDTLNAMRNLANETKNKLNEVINKLKNAGIMEQ